MNMESNYQIARRKLSALKAEEHDTDQRLQAPAKIRDPEELRRLRQRQKSLPGEILEAKLELLNTTLAVLRRDQENAYGQLRQATARTKETDERVSARLEELDRERKELTEEAHADLLTVHRLKREIAERGRGDI